MENNIVIEKKYIKEIDILKGIAIFLVVLGHSIILHPINLHEIGWCDYLFKTLTWIHMPLFFIISGFCFSYNNSYKEYITKKTFRILVPYFIFSLLDLTVRLIFPSLINRDFSLPEMLFRIAFLGGEFWFLYTLFLIFLFFPLIKKLIDKNYNFSYFFLVVFFVMMLFKDYLPQYLLLDHIANFLIYFFIGYLIKRSFSFDKINDMINNHKIVSISIAIIFLALVMLYYLIPENQMLNFLVACLGIISLTILVCLIKIPFVSWAFIKFGKWSLQIYLLNGFLLVFSRTLMVKLFGVTNPFLIISFNMLVDLILSCVLVDQVIARIPFVNMLFGMGGYKH